MGSILCSDRIKFALYKTIKMNLQTKEDNLSEDCREQSKEDPDTFPLYSPIIQRWHEGKIHRI